jgi:predicted FMN-binding regulatory protein PaiB
MASWLLAVNAADAYVSADWYASPDQVPTWLYQAVHLQQIPDLMREARPHAFAHETSWPERNVS